jgi:hypothetical protein
LKTSLILLSALKMELSSVGLLKSGGRSAEKEKDRLKAELPNEEEAGETPALRRKGRQDACATRAELPNYVRQAGAFLPRPQYCPNFYLIFRFCVRMNSVSGLGC